MRLTTNTFPTAQTSDSAPAQSDEKAAAGDLWWSLEESLQQPCLFNSGALLKKKKREREKENEIS